MRRTGKDMERAYVAEAALRLSAEWHLVDHEAPDFLITERQHQFGLEVTEIHIGEKTRRGSIGRLKESANEKWLQDIRRDFESICDVPLHLRFRGAALESSRAEMMQCLITEDFASRPVSYRQKWQWNGASLYATRSFQPVWEFIDDRAGWVSRDASILQRGIDLKAEKLAGYQAVCPDVRLLAVADRTFNSGKLVVSEDFRPDLRGFNVVYFFSYPMEMMVWTGQERTDPCPR